MKVKERVLLWLILLAACIGGASPACAQNLTFQDIQKLPAPAADYRVAYGDDPSQFGELRLPRRGGTAATAGKRHPVVIVIHGGCWYAEYDLRHLSNFSDALTRAGVATWNLEYRRLGQTGGGWPGTFQDVGRGADHLRVLARAHPLDLERVVVVGHSAGGQLALWLAARHKLPTESVLHTPDPLRLSGVVSLAGVTDLEGFGRGCGGAAGKLLGGTAREVGERYSETSPVKLLPLGIPQRLLHGALDHIVPPQLGRDYEAAAKARGDHVTLKVLERAGHFDLISPRSQAWPAVEQAVLSLLELKKKK
jgi:acetyl esterase/lipase